MAAAIAHQNKTGPFECRALVVAAALRSSPWHCRMSTLSSDTSCSRESRYASTSSCVGDHSCSSCVPMLRSTVAVADNSDVLLREIAAQLAELNGKISSIGLQPSGSPLPERQGASAAVLRSIGTQELQEWSPT